MEKIRLVQGLLTRKRAYTGPFVLTIDVTDRCNLQCPGCYIHSPLMSPHLPQGPGTPEDISVALFDKACVESRDMGTRGINMIGNGEPLFHPEFARLLEKAKSNGRFVRVVTNGTRIDAATIPVLIDSRLDELRVSLWAHSPESYVRSHPGTRPDMFQRIVDGLRMLVEEKKRRRSDLPRLIMHYPISNKNYDTIEETADFAKKAGFDSLSFSPLRNWEGRLSALALTPWEQRQTVESLQRLKGHLGRLSLSHNIDQTLKRYQIGEAVLGRLPCYVGWVHARIRTDGTVLPCCLFPVGNLTEEPLKRIWNGSEMQRFREHTLTGTELTEIVSQGKCGYCGHVIGNEEIDRVFRRLKPFAFSLPGGGGRVQSSRG